MQGGRLERTLEMTIMIRALNQTTGAFSGVRLAAMAAIGAIGVGLAYSVKQAADFQQGLTTLVTGAGEAASNLQMVGDGIKQVSIETGTTTDDLIKSMFLIESANFRGAAGLQVLLTAAEGAKVGNTDLAKTTQVLLTMLHDYHQPASQAVADTNSIIATVKNGTMTMDDLNGALKNVLSIASAFHIKLSDVEAALATMSVAGDKGSAAGTHLAMMLRMLSNPATTAANEMAAMGINSVNLANEMRISLPLALQEIETAVARHFTPGSVEFNRAITTILGGTRSGVAGLELMNANLPIFRANAANAASAAATAGNNVNGWSLVQQDFNTKLAQTQQALNVAAIDIGTVLIPWIEQALAWVTPLIGQFTNWVENSYDLQNAVTTVATAIGNLAQGAGNLFQAFQQGQSYALAMGDALFTIGAAIAVIRIELFVANLVKTWQTLSQGNGVIANLASKAFPQLAEALGWTTTKAEAMEAALAQVMATEQMQAQVAQVTAMQTAAAAAEGEAALAEAYTAAAYDAYDEMIAIGIASATEIADLQSVAVASETKAIQLRADANVAMAAATQEAVTVEAAATAEASSMVAASGAMTLAFGVATAGISLIVGAVIAGIAQSALSGKTAIQNASKDVQDTYNALGNSADDLAAKQQADAIIAQGQYNKMADTSSRGWHQAASQMAQDSANLKAQMVLDAQRSSDAWSQWIEYFHSLGIDPISGGKWNPASGTKPGGPHTQGNLGNVQKFATSQMGIGGPRPVGHAAGIMNSPFGHMAALAERGSEWMYIPGPTAGYVPKGASVFPHGTSPGGTTININVSTLAGSRAEVMRMVDLIETELASRFRTQTNSFSLRGVS